VTEPESNNKLSELERELAKLRALFDMQWQRMTEATARWRAEDPEARALVMPDLGDLLQWLMADADNARSASVTKPRADKVLILARCGHWWIEHRPPVLKVDHATPRVCSTCRPDVPAAVGTSPQGLALVPVSYVDEWSEEKP